MKHLGRFHIIWFLLTVLCVAPTVQCEPLRQSNRFPLMLMVLTPEPMSPYPPKLRATLGMSADYSTVFMNKIEGSWQAVIDMELAVLTPEFELSLGERYSVGARFPFVHMNQGIFDGSLEDYHEWGNFPEYGRKHRPHDEFAYTVTKNGQPWFTGKEDGLHPADSRMFLKYLCHADMDTAMALLYTLKVPTGDDTRGLGSGGFDHGFFLLSQASKGPMTYYLSPGLILPSNPRTLGADIDFNPMGTLFMGGEYQLGSWGSFIGQLNIYQSPMKSSDNTSLSRPCAELAMGLSRKSQSGLLWDISFTEDLSGPSSDFTVRASLRMDVGL